MRMTRPAKAPLAASRARRVFVELLSGITAGGLRVTFPEGYNEDFGLPD